MNEHNLKYYKEKISYLKNTCNAKSPYRGDRIGIGKPELRSYADQLFQFESNPCYVKFIKSISMIRIFYKTNTENVYLLKHMNSLTLKVEGWELVHIDNVENY